MQEDGPAGLTPQQKLAMTQAFEMRDNGQSCDAAANHLVASGMPRVVAKVLVNQYDRRSGRT